MRVKEGNVLRVVYKRFYYRYVFTFLSYKNHSSANNINVLEFSEGDASHVASSLKLTRRCCIFSLLQSSNDRYALRRDTTEESLTRANQKQKKTKKC